MQTVKTFIGKWAKKKRFYAILIILLIIGFVVLRPKVNTSIVVDTVKLQDLESTVLATGDITSSTDLSLSFNSTGIVKSMQVKVGDKVYKGQTLATLDGGTLYGSLQSAQGSLQAAKARYDKLMAGTSNEEINLAQVALKNAEDDLVNTKNQQNLLVTNARKSLLSGGLAVALDSNTNAGVAPTISGTYNGVAEGKYIINTYNTGSGAYFNITGLSGGGDQINNNTPIPLGSDGLYISFPSGFSASTNAIWVIDIPNKKSSSYLTNLNALDTALETKTKTIAGAQAVVDSKVAELAVKKAAARTFELDLAEADVLSAEGQVQSASASYNNTILRAPARGTIIQVYPKLGELAEMQKEAIVLQDVDNLYLEANINESNIIKLEKGQKVTFSIDSFGPNASFEGKVFHIDPGATTNDGIVNYKIKISIAKADKRIRPGMNADIKILISKKENVLVAPKLSLVERDDKTYLRVITDTETKKYEEREVVTGMKGDGNLIEIVSGVKDGEAIAVINKNS